MAVDVAVVTFCWGKYGAGHVNTLRRMVAANLTVPHNFACVTDKPDGMECETYPLPEVPHIEGRPRNFAKLFAFDAKFQRSLKAKRIVLLDLDAVICDDITPLVQHDAPFAIMRGTVSRHGGQLAPYNSSFWTCKPGKLGRVWESFGPDAKTELDAVRMPGRGLAVGSDQVWIASQVPDAPTLDEADGLYQYVSLPAGDVPENARIVFFAGDVKQWSDAVWRSKPAVAAAWRCYAEDKVLPFQPRNGGRCLVLGRGDTIWEDVDAAIDRGEFDGVVAVPEAALHWPRPVDGLVLTIDACIRRAKALGFTDLVICGAETKQLEAA